MHKLWSVLFAVVNLGALGLFLVAPSYGWWLPKDVSTTGHGIDFLFYLILYVTGFFFILTEAILVYCMWVYAAEEGRKSQYVHGNHNLEIFWTAVTSVILLVVAFWQVPVWAEIKFPQAYTKENAPDQLLEVSARQFEWRVRYPTTEKLEQLRANWDRPALLRQWSEEGQPDDVRVVNQVHVWKQSEEEGGKVRVMLKTRDVLHSFFLPNLRIKQDAVPGRTIPVWFAATQHNVEWDEQTQSWRQLERWPLACAELCGWGHYKMQGELYVHKNKAEYDRWLKMIQEEQTRRSAE